MSNRGLREGRGMFEIGIGYEKDKVTDEQVLGVTEG